MRSAVTGTPAARSARANPSSSSSGSWSAAPAAAVAHHGASIRSSACADPLGVLAVLHHRAERAARRSRGRARAAPSAPAPGPSRASRRRPGGLSSSSADRSRCTSATTCRASVSDDLGRAGAHDLDLPVQARVLDPVVEAAALERVVQLAGAVGGEHDDRRGRRGDRAELGDRHLVGREHLEQERLELVVGPVDLVDEQHRRALAQGPQHRPGEQEPLVEQRLLRAVGVASPRRPPAGLERPAGAGSGAGSPSRRAPAPASMPS